MVTVFSWGYFGWGNATEQLVRLMDAVARDQGFNPPVFVDIRIRRTVRAKGFSGPAFENLLGTNRHVWVKGLGNEAIVTGEGGIRIADPTKAGDLLDLALADTGRQVIFFCSCQWPMEGGGACHRRTVGSLLLNAARRRGEEIEVVEWPGGEPGEMVRNVEPEVLAAVRRGRTSIPLGERLPVAGWRGLAWGSLVRVRCGGEEARVIAGPARYRFGAWEIPVLKLVPESTSDEGATRRGAALRRALGLKGRARPADPS